MEDIIDLKIKDAEWAKLPILDRKVANEKEEKALREMIVCEFYNQEEPGLSVKFPYGTTNFSKTFQLFHGGKYRIPKFLKQHIESKATPIWAWRPNGIGGMDKQITGYKSRFQMREIYG